MSGFFQSIFQVFFLFGYLILYTISVIILRPFRVHKRRRKSTISIKLSYLLFLFFFLIFTYLLLFGEKVIPEGEEPYDSLFNIHFLVFLSATLVPNIGIMLRRRIKKKRIEYNLIFTFINSLYASYLFYLTASGQWALL